VQIRANLYDAVMAQLNVSLTDRLKDRVDHIVAGGSYASASDYIRDLIRRDEQRSDDLAELQALIDEGIASGIDTRPPATVIEDIIARRRDG